MENMRILPEARAQLVRYMYRNQCWASEEETAQWLKTEEGKCIHALIEELRRKERAG